MKEIDSIDIYFFLYFAKQILVPIIIVVAIIMIVIYGIRDYKIKKLILHNLQNIEEEYENKSL